MRYISIMENMHFELAADYLVMASTLAEIKSKLLLPVESDEDDEEDPRANLIKRLLEYQKYKNASERLEEIQEIIEISMLLQMQLIIKKQ